MRIVVTRAVRSSGGADHHPRIVNDRRFVNDRIVCVGSGAGPASNGAGPASNGAGPPFNGAGPASNGAGPASNGAGCAPPTVDERRDERTSSAVVSSRLLFSS